MLHPTRLDPESTTRQSHTCQPPGAVSPGPALGGRWPRRVLRLGGRWLRALGTALVRAEKHISENFRVPPHGG